MRSFAFARCFLSWVRSILGCLLLMGTLPGQAAWDTFLKGEFGPVVGWPLIPIHAAVLPDGRIMSYGTDGQGRQGAQFSYSIWRPTSGTNEDAHLILDNRTGADTFCSGQILLPASGQLLITGGDRTVDDLRNFSIRDVNLFDYRNDILLAARQPMASPRWYPSVLTLASGEVLVLGGRADPTTSAPTPEIFNESLGWRELIGAVSDEAYGTRNGLYPRAWQAPNGKVFVASRSGETYYLDVAGQGRLERTSLMLPPSHVFMPSVMFAPGKILSLRLDNKAVVVDLNGFTPKAHAIPGAGQDRFHASATVMADGRVLVNGGSKVDNAIDGVAYMARIWNPLNGNWSNAAEARRMRLYHSVSLLLPDGRVLTAGGGAPGPVQNLNAEIYTPPYLYRKDIFAKLANRPRIMQAPDVATWGQNVQIAMNVRGARRVTLVKTGSATHTVDFDQRFMELRFSASGNTLNISMPISAEVAPPGYYMLFVFNGAGVPSVAKIVRLG